MTGLKIELAEFKDRPEEVSEDINLSKETLRYIFDNLFLNKISFEIFKGYFIQLNRFPFKDELEIYCKINFLGQTDLNGLYDILYCLIHSIDGYKKKNLKWYNKKDEVKDLKEIVNKEYCIACIDKWVKEMKGIFNIEELSPLFPKQAESKEKEKKPVSKEKVSLKAKLLYFDYYRKAAEINYKWLTEFNFNILSLFDSLRISDKAKDDYSFLHYSMIATAKGMGADFDITSIFDELIERASGNLGSGKQGFEAVGLDFVIREIERIKKEEKEAKKDEIPEKKE